MKNITAQYRDLQEGRMTKANFMANVRMQFPDYISPVNSYEDMIKILKSKRILSEVQDLDKTTSQLDTEGDKKAFYLVDETGDVIDSVMAVDSQEASDYFESEYEGIGSTLTVIHTSNPDELRGGVAEDLDQHTGTLEERDTDKMSDSEIEELAYQLGIEDSIVKDGEGGIANSEEMIELIKANEKDANVAEVDSKDIDALRKGALREAVDAKLEAAKEKARKKSEEGYVQHVNREGDNYTISDWFDADSTVASYENGEQINEVKKSLNEAVEKPEGSYKKVTGKDLYSFFNEIDRVNPYEVKKGINIEMGIQYSPVPNYFTDDFNPESLAKATRKVLKNLQKDPAYYTNMISLETEKRTNMLQKPKEIKVKADGATKVKGFADAKANTETSLVKKERAKGSPEGVKEMKPSKKSMGGIKTMKSNDKLPKGVELMKESAVSNAIFDRNKNITAGLNKLAASDLEAKAKEMYLNSLKKDKEQNPTATPDMKSDDMKSKLKELVMQEVKKRLQEKINAQDVAQAAAAGETLNIPSSDSQAIQAAKSKKISFTTYE